MTITPRKLLRFLGLFFVTFIVLLTVYLATPIVSYYEPYVFSVANAFMHQMDPPTEMGNDSGGAWRSYIVSEGYTRMLTTWNRGVKYLHYLSLALVPALIIATPAPWSVRLRLLLLMLPLLYIEHVIAIIAVVRTHYCIAMERGNILCKIGMRIANTSGQIFGAAVWALLTFRYWIDDGHAHRSPAQPKPADDPSPG